MSGAVDVDSIRNAMDFAVSQQRINAMMNDEQIDIYGEMFARTMEDNTWDAENWTEDADDVAYDILENGYCRTLEAYNEWNSREAH